MGFEDKYQDLLQNIEFAILAVYRNDPDVRDWDTIKALDALIQHYQRLAAGRETTDPNPTGAPLEIFHSVNQVLYPWNNCLSSGRKGDSSRRGVSRRGATTQRSDFLHASHAENQVDTVK